MKLRKGKTDKEPDTGQKLDKEPELYGKGGLNMF